MSPGDCLQNVNQIRFDIQLKTKAPLDDPHPIYIVGSFILSDVVIKVFPPLPPLFIWGGGLCLFDYGLVIKQLSLPGLYHVLNTSLSVVHECELLLSAFSIVAHNI